MCTKTPNFERPLDYSSDATNPYPGVIAVHGILFFPRILSETPQSFSRFAFVTRNQLK
jgi:hypothetical protein